MRRRHRAGVEPVAERTCVADALRVIERDHERGIVRARRLALLLEETLAELEYWDRETAGRLRTEVWTTAFTNAALTQDPEDR